MLSLQTLLALFSVQEPMGWGYQARGGLGDGVTPILIVAFSILGVVALVWIKSRAKLQEQRLALIRDLADKGQLSPERLDAMLQPKSKLKPAVMVAAWFMLLGGGGMLTVALAEDWPQRYNEFGAPGVTMLGLAVATLSAPIMLRELRKQNVV